MSPEMSVTNDAIEHLNAAHDECQQWSNGMLPEMSVTNGALQCHLELMP